MNMARKDFSSAALVIDKGSSNHIIADHLSKTINFVPESYVINFPESPLTVRKLDFGRYYGVGCDEVTYYCHKVIEVLLGSAIASQGKTKSVASIITYAKRVSRSFYAIAHLCQWL